MSPRRPTLPDPSSSSSAAEYTPLKEGPLSGLSLYIIQAKLPPSSVGELFKLAEELGAAIVPNIEDADIIVTAITMRARLERHIPWKLAMQKDVVTPAWLHECAAQHVRLSAQLFPALRTVSTQTPNRLKRKTPPGQLTPPQSPYIRTGSRTATPQPPLSPTATPPPDTPPPEGLPMMPPRELLEQFPPKSKSAVMRLHPLVCPNQRLVEELGVIRNARKLEGEDRSALSYSRAIASIKAQPAEFRTIKDIKDVPFVGTKIANMVEEYLNRGRISEAEELRASERFTSLSELTTIHGIGPATAREHYARGLRTLESLDRFYGVVVPDGYGGWVRNDAELDVRDEDGLESVIREALALRGELNQKISRQEVERIAEAVFNELEAIEPGCLYTICGGYRRGKPESNDVDIVFTHPEARRVRGLCTRLVERLKIVGIVMRSWSHNQTFRKIEPDRVHSPGLDKSLVVLRLAPDPTARRVDLIFAPPEAYWAAVVGWTGSIMFERDLRLAAKEQGLKFNDSGITRRVNGEVIPAKDERDVFAICGVPWVEPVWRNADL